MEVEYTRETQSSSEEVEYTRETQSSSEDKEVLERSVKKF